MDCWNVLKECSEITRHSKLLFKFCLEFTRIAGKFKRTVRTLFGMVLAVFEINVAFWNFFERLSELTWTSGMF